MSDEYTWIIHARVEESPSVVSFYLAPKEGERPDFIAGQYLTVKLSDLGPAEGKAYSIASAPHEAYVRLSIKQIGAFSSALRALREGDTLTTTAPYGFFYPEEGEEAPLIFVVGGIGITPVASIVKDLTHRGDSRPLTLHYGNREESEVLFRDELKVLTQEHPALTVHHYLSREEPTTLPAHAGRMSPAALLEGVDLSREPEFFICGAMDFTKALWSGLHDAGVPQHQLYTEGFF